MKLKRLSGPLVAAIATMLLAGGSVALATDLSVPPASAGTTAEEPGTSGPDTDNVQDESEADDAAEADAGAPDTDNVQEEVGDGTPD